jgi:hypothetical protein
MSFNFYASILHFTIGFTLFGNTVLKAQAQEMQITQDANNCQKEHLVITKKKPLDKFSKLFSNAPQSKTQENNFSQSLEKNCEASEPIGSEDSSNSSTDANINELSNGTNSDSQSDIAEVSEDSTTFNNESDIYPKDSSDSGNNTPGQETFPSSITNRDSHDVDFTLQINLGGSDTSPLDSSNDFESGTTESTFSDTSPPPYEYSDEENLDKAESPKSKAGDKKTKKKKEAAKHKHQRDSKKTHKQQNKRRHSGNPSHRPEKFSLEKHGKADKKAKIKSYPNKMMREIRRKTKHQFKGHRNKGNHKIGISKLQKRPTHLLKNRRYLQP